ncbi:sugar phosphate isomerase/epimerase [Maribacter sp. BPC-D8]|uniref:sugar phosphate isomerase/epimerase n=1 Tax=Maribacter sp. BPC-D8 TaxID=3053613 RepID=UPI002B49D5B6|nr:sugar phosphate isomerase/epimerase [Maribacter sp. BPC-D8]WRI30698.1 sugar phosphate isomerase/epimerase [Maribacter sp. BPC-D8]
MATIKYLYPHWGSENLTAKEFIELVISKGFEGIEINLPNDKTFENELLDELQNIRKRNPSFIVVLQQVLPVKKETVQEYISNVLKQLKRTLPYQPDFINSHTGKDHYSFDENSKVIEAIESFSSKHKIPIYHEIHRGRFTFHSASTLTYLQKYPKLKLVGDLSHWCVTSESMLQDQEHVLEQIFPHIIHIHARIGFEQCPQVNNPFAPEWEAYLDQFMTWWQRIIKQHQTLSNFTITPEFGPFPYMPQAPFSKEPLANQLELNIEMKKYLESKLSQV